jgi:hypothetical protein
VLEADIAEPDAISRAQEAAPKAIAAAKAPLPLPRSAVHAHDNVQDTTARVSDVTTSACVEVSSAFATAPTACAKAYPSANCNAIRNATDVWAHVASCATRAQCVDVAVRGQAPTVTNRVRDAATELKSLRPSALARQPLARMPGLPVPPPSPPLLNLLVLLMGPPLVRLPHPRYRGRYRHMRRGCRLRSHQSHQSLQGKWPRHR